MKKANNVTVLDIQMIAVALSIVSFLISLFLLYNQKLLEQKRDAFFSKQETLNYVALNRLFVLAIVFLFLGANELQLKIDKEQNKDLKFDYLDILSSLLSLLVSVIAIYMAYAALKDSNLEIDESVDEGLI